MKLIKGNVIKEVQASLVVDYVRMGWKEYKGIKEEKIKKEIKK